MLVIAVQPVFLSPSVYPLTGFGQVSALAMLYHLLPSYRSLDEINLEEDAVKTMETYESMEALSQLIQQLEKR